MFPSLWPLTAPRGPQCSGALLPGAAHPCPAVLCEVSGQEAAPLVDVSPPCMVCLVALTQAPQMQFQVPQGLCFQGRTFHLALRTW